MGGIISKPKAPEPVIIQQPAPAAPDPVIETPTAPDPTEAQEAESRERARSLLARERGRLGTIATGFRGFLQERAQSERKTLLGE